MQTIYTTSYRLGVRCDNVLDLNEYRRKLGLSVAEEEEPEQPAVELDPLLWAREREPSRNEVSRPRSRARKAAGISAWCMDICASAGVLAMTLAFTIHIL